jgi:ABC-type transport system involved in cytochrome bd biosynthesis fused ATPase/permease subunit
MNDFEAAAKAFLRWLTPFVEAFFGFIGATIQVVFRAPEVVALTLAVPVLTLAVVLSVRYRRRVKRLNLARRQQEEYDQTQSSLQRDP